MQWLRNNTLSLNETETELIVFISPSKHFPRVPDIRINNYKVKLHSHIKYLGILIDEVLSWNKQIHNICTKLTRANGIISKIRHFVPKKPLHQYITLYFTPMAFMVVWFGATQHNVI